MNGTYGTIKPAVVNIEKDVEILYNYSPNRGYNNSNTFQKLPTSNLLNTYLSDDNSISIDGLYNLKLPLLKQIVENIPEKIKYTPKLTVKFKILLFLVR